MATPVHNFILGIGIDVVSLLQHKSGKFKIVYGAHIKKHLTYSEAAKEYGECVFHSLTCAGLIES